MEELFLFHLISGGLQEKGSCGLPSFRSTPGFKDTVAEASPTAIAANQGKTEPSYKDLLNFPQRQQSVCLALGVTLTIRPDFTWDRVNFPPSSWNSAWGLASLGGW